MSAEPAAFYRAFAPFLTGVRVFFVMERKKDSAAGVQSHSHASTLKRITRSEDEAIRVFEGLLSVVRSSATPQRLYLSVNERNLDKAIREFKRLQLDMDYQSAEDRQSFYLDIKNRWVSCLMQQSARQEHNFLFDCDSVAQRDLLRTRLARVEVEEIASFQTKNGVHVITPPHDPSLTKVEGVNCHKDGLLLLGWTREP